MTVYDGAVRIQGNDGRDLRAWRVAVYQSGQAVRYATVPAENVADATRRIRERLPNGGTVVAF